MDESRYGMGAELWDLNTTMRRTTLSKSTIYNLEKAGKFPKRRKAATKVVWLASDVIEWMHNLETADEERESSALTRQGG